MTEVFEFLGDTQQDEPTGPYKGLGSYTEADKEYFFARDSFRDLLAANLMASRLTVLYGPSGVGKSSLLQAGLIPLLRKTAEGEFSYLAVQDAIVVYSDSWRNDPLAELGSALLQAVSEPAKVSDLMARAPALSVELVQDLAARFDANIYLLLDQFEELALSHTGATAQDLYSELGRIMKASGVPVSILLGVRDDALAELDQLEPYVPDILDNRLRLEHLTPDEAQEAIEQPLVRYNALVPDAQRIDIESELESELLAQLVSGSVSVGEKGEGVVVASQSVEAPYLQLVMTRLWDAEIAQGSHWLRVKTLRQLGGAEQIVSTHLDAVLGEFSEEQRETASRVFRHMVTKSGRKISHDAETLAALEELDPAKVQEVLELLSAARAVRPVPAPLGSDQGPRYEIFHDVMAPAVLNWRRRYLAERDRASLVREKQEVEARHEATRHRLRVVERVLLITLALLLIMTGATLVWVIRSNKAMRQAGQLALYREALRTDPSASLKFALNAWDERHTSEAEDAVRTGLDANSELVNVAADTRLVATSELSPDGRMLTAGADGIAKLFDADTGRTLRSFQPIQSARRPGLKAASFSPDRSQVLTLAWDGKVHLYDSATGKDLGLPFDRGSYRQAVWGTVDKRPVVLTVDVDKPPHLWDMQRETVVATYGTRPSLDAALSSDGRYVVSLDYAKDGQRASVWDAASGRLLQRSKTVGTDVLMAGFAGTESGQVVFFAIRQNGARGQLMSWAWRQGSGAVRTLSEATQKPGNIVSSVNGRLVAAPMDKRVQVFDADTGKLVGQTATGPDWVRAPISFSPDGHLLATTSADGRALLWLSEQLSNRPLAELIGHHGALADVRFDPHSDWRLTTAGHDGTARIWQLPERTILPSGVGSIRGAELSRSDQYLLTAGQNGDLRVHQRKVNAAADQWNEPRQVSISRYGELIGASFSPDGLKVVAAGELSRAPSVWAWNSSSRPEALNPWTNPIMTQPVVSADGRRVAAGDVKGDVIVWDLESHKIIAQLRGSGVGSLVPALVAVPGSDWFAAPSTDGTVRLWDPDRRQAPQKTFGNPGGSPIAAVEISNDGANLASVCENDEVKIWRLSDGEPIQEFQGATNSHSSVAFSRDGTLVATGAADGTIHIWHWADGHKLAALHRHGDSVNTVLFTANDSLLAASESGVTVFRCTTCGPFDDLIKIAKDRLSAQQR